MTSFPSRVLRRFVLVVVGTVLAAPVFAGWASLGAMPAPQREGNALVFRSAQGIVSVSALSADVVRVRFSPSPAFGRDHSYAVVKTDLGDPGATFDVGAAQSTVTTSSLKVTVRHDPFRVAFATAAGESLDEDDPERGMAWTGTQVKVSKRLREDEHVYGLGEKTGRLDKRGRNLGGYSYTMWNSDTFAYGDDTDPIYVSVPFFMVLRGGRSHGIFFDNTFRSQFDVGHEKQELLSFGAEGGELNYYFIYGPAPKQVVQRYTEMTGRMPLPPLWALGFHQCRYSYYPEAKVRDIAQNFRTREIPADVIWLDIHYLDGYKPFTWDKERFPNPGKLIADLRKDGFRTVTIVDPHPKKEVGYEPYDTGKAGDHFVKNPDGTDYVAPVWPNNAEKNPGPSVFPDFTKPAARTWWGGLYKKPYLDLGVAGIWNDMNEPAVFIDPIHTMPPQLRHDNEGQPTDHREVHNVYGMLMSRATYEGLLRLRPNERPFILSRASFAGGQRYAALWPGDNTSDWNHLRATIPMFGGMGLSGLAFVGSDIGGFADAPTPELFTRWLQLGVFYPFMRVHSAFGTPDQEPWSYGERHEAVNKRAIELRYELLPHIYNVMQQTSETGLPAFRPLLLDYPDDPATYERDDEFLFGSDLLVAPALREPATEREVYLPAGDWYDFWNNTKYEGGKGMKVPLTLDKIPVFVKGGAFVFRQPAVQHTGQMPGMPLVVDVYPAARSESSLYEDDGTSLDYTRGKSSRRVFRQTREDGRCVIDIDAPTGAYRPAARDLVVRVRFDSSPKTVRIGDEVVTATTTDFPGARGYSYAPLGVVNIRLADTFGPIQLVIER